MAFPGQRLYFAVDISILKSTLVAGKSEIFISSGSKRRRGFTRFVLPHQALFSEILVLSC